MIDRIKALLAGGDVGTVDDDVGRDDEMKLAAAALMVESAFMDGEFDDAERATISELLKSQFGLSTEESDQLIAVAEQAVQESGQLYEFTRVVKDRYSADERVWMIEMIWQVAYADGRVDHFESNLIRRVAGLLYVSDRDRGEAKKRVVARLGIVPSSV